MKAMAIVQRVFFAGSHNHHLSINRLLSVIHHNIHNRTTTIHHPKSNIHYSSSIIHHPLSTIHHPLSQLPTLIPQ